jgi:hypothetical protein
VIASVLCRCQPIADVPAVDELLNAGAARLSGRFLRLIGWKTLGYLLGLSERSGSAFQQKEDCPERD